MILPLAFLDAMTSAGSFILQTSGGSGPGEVTVLVALITLADAAGSTLAMRLPPQVCAHRSRSRQLARSSQASP